MKFNAFVTSKYTRRMGDHYPTVDPRCIKALLNTWGDHITTPAVDVCTTRGIASPLLPAVSGDLKDMLGAYRTVITNPPYRRPLVDKIVNLIVDSVEDNHIDLAAILVRISWDAAKTRKHLFCGNKNYAGKTILLFRPFWSAERKASPIHNYQWLVWRKTNTLCDPIVKYSGGE